MRHLRLSLTLVAAAIAACSPNAGTTGGSIGSTGGSTGTTGTACGNLTCPAGCSVSANCTSCVPNSPDAGLGNACTTDTDCCTGNCIRGTCQLVSTTTTTGTTSASSGTTSGSVCTEAPAGDGCQQTSDCANADFYCAPHNDGGFCKALCPACACLGGLTCNAAGICEATSTTTGASTTSGVLPTSTTGSAASTSGTAAGTTSSSSGTTSGTTGAATTGSTSGTSGIITRGTTGGTSAGTTSGTTSGTTGSSGTIPVGDTCSTCLQDSDCSGATDYCVVDENADSNGFCAPDCTSGTCSSGYTCSTEQDGNGSEEQVCYPSSGTCVGGSTTGGGGVGTECTSNSQCTSDYCPASSGICTCNCGGGVYPCVTDSDCCLTYGGGNSCDHGTKFSSGCSGGFCQ